MYKMLSSDLLSFSDSGDSPLTLDAAGEFSPYQLQQQQQALGGLSLFEELADVVSDADCSQVPTPLSTKVTGNIPASTNTEKAGLSKNRKVIEINMVSDQEDELVRYLTGATDGQTPCLKIVRKSTESTPSPPPVSFHDPGLCMSKNAIAAREMRQKKKAHVKNLEKTVEKLTAENKFLKSQTVNMKSCVRELKDEVAYLRRVLANQSALAGLLKNIQNTQGVKFQSSLSPMAAVHTTAKKPTATVTGRVKAKTVKRKIPVTDLEDDTFSENNPDLAMKKQKTSSVNDHLYAADPDVHKSSAGCLHNKSSLQVHSSDDISVLSEEDSETMGGICLHVSQGSVSIELCAVCSGKAASVDMEPKENV